jgi:hypothetical protein
VALGEVGRVGGEPGNLLTIAIVELHRSKCCCVGIDWQSRIRATDRQIKEIDMMRVIPLGVAIVLLTSGCATFASAPTVSQASSDGVTYRVKGSQLDKATDLARAHCATYGRTAVQDRVSTGPGGNRTASFNCR